MSLLEQLADGMRTNPDGVTPVIDSVLRSNFDTEAAFREYREAEYAIQSLFKVLVSKRSVVGSTFNMFEVHHPNQYDLYEPITLGKAAGKLICYPIRIYDDARSIEGKSNGLKVNVIRPVTSLSRRTYDAAVHEKWCGYLFTPSILDLSRGEGKLPMAIEDVEADFTTLTRSNPGDWLVAFAVDQERRENQARFRQLTEELLTHEGHKQVPTWQ